MKPVALVGLVLILLGIAALAYQGITYRQRETVLDLGPIHATAERQHTIPLPPGVGVAAIVSGLVLVVLGTKKS